MGHRGSRSSPKFSLHCTSFDPGDATIRGLSQFLFSAHTEGSLAFVWYSSH